MEGCVPPSRMTKESVTDDVPQIRSTSISEGAFRADVMSDKTRKSAASESQFLSPCLIEWGNITLGFGPVYECFLPRKSPSAQGGRSTRAVLWRRGLHHAQVEGTLDWTRACPCLSIVVIAQIASSVATVLDGCQAKMCLTRWRTTDLSLRSAQFQSEK